jgi:hypothetical protein
VVCVFFLSSSSSSSSLLFLPLLSKEIFIGSGIVFVHSHSCINKPYGTASYNLTNSRVHLSCRFSVDLPRKDSDDHKLPLRLKPVTI